MATVSVGVHGEDETTRMPAAARPRPDGANAVNGP